MKQLLLFAVLALLSGIALAAAEAINVNGQFAPAATQKEMPEGWVVNANIKPSGTVKFNVADRSLTVDATKANCYVYFNTFTPAKSGDQFTIKAEVSGIGKCGVGLDLYNAKGEWLSCDNAVVVSVNGKKTLDRRLEIPTSAMGQPVAQVKLVLYVYTGEIELRKIKFERIAQ